MNTAAQTSARKQKSISTFQDTEQYRDLTGVIRSSPARSKSAYHGQASRKQRIETLVKSLVEKQQIPTRMALTTSSACIKTSDADHARASIPKHHQTIWEDVEDVWTVIKRASKQRRKSLSAIDSHQDHSDAMQIDETVFVSPIAHRSRLSISQAESHGRASQQVRQTSSASSIQSKITSSYRKSKMLHVSDGVSPIVKTAAEHMSPNTTKANPSNDAAIVSDQAIELVNARTKSNCQSTASPFVYHKRQRPDTVELHRSPGEHAMRSSLLDVSGAVETATGSKILAIESAQQNQGDVSENINIDQAEVMNDNEQIMVNPEPLDYDRTSQHDVRLNSTSRSPVQRQVTPAKTIWPGTQAMIAEAQQSLFRSPLVPDTDQQSYLNHVSTSSNNEKTDNGTPAHQRPGSGKLRRSTKNLPNTQSLLAGWTAWSPDNASTSTSPAQYAFSTTTTPMTLALPDIDKEHLRLIGLQKQPQTRSKLRQSDVFSPDEMSFGADEPEKDNADSTVITATGQDAGPFNTPAQDPCIFDITSHNEESELPPAQYDHFTNDESILNGTITEIAQALLSSPA